MATTAGSALPAAGGTSASTLSDWAGPYVTDMLGKAKAISNQDYQAYGGPMTAEQSALQTGVFRGLGSLATPTSIGDAATTAGTVATNAGNLSYTPYGVATNQFTSPSTYSPTTSNFDSTQAETYMNPYLQQALTPQLQEARRQAQISQQGNNAQATQAGAFGGSRQALSSAENQRNLASTLQGITGQGYNTAYTNAQQQFNADQARKMQEAQFGAQQDMTAAQQGAQYGQAAQAQNEQSKQFGANYGLQGLSTQLQAAQAQGQLGSLENATDINTLNAQLAGGNAERAINQEGITADYNEFLTQRDYPMKQVQFEQSMLQGLPTSTVTNTAAQTSTAGNIASAVGGLGSLFTGLSNLGINWSNPATTTAPG